MLADVLEGMRGRLVSELERRAAATERSRRSNPGRRQRLAALVGQVIKALRGGAPGDPAELYESSDPEVDLIEHDLVERCILEQIDQNGLKVSPGENVIVRQWQRSADWQCLREQNRRLRSLLDDVYERAVLFAPDGRVLYCNEREVQALHELGIPRDEIIGKTPDELGVPLELLVGRPVGELVSMGRARESFEVSTLGRAREARFHALYRSDGSVSAVALLICDIENRRKAHMRAELLRELGAIVGTLDYDEVAAGLAQVPIPELADWCAFTVIEDRRVRRTFVADRDPSKASLRDPLRRALSGWDRHPLWQELLAFGFQLLTEVTDDLLRRITTDEQYRLLSQLGIRSLMIVPLVSRAQVTGILTLAYTSQSGRRYDGGAADLAVEIAWNAARVLENARLMTDLKVSETRFRVAVAGARTVVFEQDASLHYTWYYNPLVPTDLQAEAPEEALPPDEASFLKTTKKQVLERGVGINGEVDLTLGNDERRHFREAIEPVRDHTGKIVGIIGAATDITEQQSMRQQLTEDVAFRERMMGVLSHDLRNPLNTITMSEELLLQRQGVPSKDREQLLRIRRSADRMKEMIETLLDFTRLRSGAFPVSPAQANLGDIARAVVDEARASNPDHAIDLEVHGDVRGEWDPARVSQAVSNLVGNALVYGDRGTPVSVAVLGGDRDVFVTVNNRGVPIPPSLLSVIFEPFRRGVTSDRSPHGLGLGLYVVQQIVLAHGGEISAESNAEEGTTFTARLPRRPAAPATPDSARHRN